MANESGDSKVLGNFSKLIEVVSIKPTRVSSPPMRVPIIRQRECHPRRHGCRSR